MRHVLIFTDSEEETPLTFDGEFEFPTTGTLCPHCQHKLHVFGNGVEQGGRDYYKARGFCTRLECKKPVGEIRAYVSTIFGIEEDEKTLAGPWKVY